MPPTSWGSRRKRSRTCAGAPGTGSNALEREHDNFRAALDRLEASGDSETALRLVAALWRFWYLKGHLAEGRRRLESVLLTDERPTAARAKALNGAAVMAVNTEDTEAAKLRAEEALALHRKLGDAWGAAYSVFMLGAAEADDWRGHSSSTRRASGSSVSSATSTPPCWWTAISRRSTPTSATANALERSTRTTSSEHGQRTTIASKRARWAPWR